MGLRILVTGGAGFIGSHTADALIESGHQVRILDNLQQTVHPKGKPEYLNSDAEFILGDVRDRETWRGVLKGIDAVYHFAAYQDYLTDFSTFFHVNTVSTALLYEILINEGIGSNIKKVIVATSQAVMGEGKYVCPVCFEKDKRFIYPQIRLEEQLSRGEWEHRCSKCNQILNWRPSDETVVNPCNQYAISKYSQEQIAVHLSKRYRIPSVVMRYSIVQGPRQSVYNAYSGAMRIFALSLLMNRKPIIFEDGNQVRDFVNIDDVVEANLVVLENDAADYNVYNVGGGQAGTIREFYNTMQSIAGKEMEPVVSGFYRYGDTRHICSDITTIKSLGWKPTRSIEESIKTYWEYIQRQEELANILEYAENHMKQLHVIRKIKDPD